MEEFSGNMLQFVGNLRSNTQQPKQMRNLNYQPNVNSNQQQATFKNQYGVQHGNYVFNHPPVQLGVRPNGGNGNPNTGSHSYVHNNVSQVNMTGSTLQNHHQNLFKDSYSGVHRSSHLPPPPLAPNPPKAVKYIEHSVETPIHPSDYDKYVPPFSIPRVGVGILSNYENFEQVGEGAYGYVYKASSKMDNKTYALKKLVFSKDINGVPLNSLREIKCLKQLSSHPNIVTLIDIVSSKGAEHLESTIEQVSLRSAPSEQAMSKKCTTLNASDSDKDRTEKNDPIMQAMYDMSRCGSLYLVFEYVDHDLSGLLDSKKHIFSLIEVKYVLKQLLAVLVYLKDNHIIHRDIKTANILISNDMKVKLADFGLARSIQNPNQLEFLEALDVGTEEELPNHKGATKKTTKRNKPLLTNNVVTLWYRSPELLLGSQSYDYGIDVWSVGCILAEIELKRPIFAGKTELDQLETIFKVIGTPSLNSYPEMKHLPLFDAYLANMLLYSKNSLSSLYGQLISNQSMSLLQYFFFVPNPQRRASAATILKHEYFTKWEPLPPSDRNDENETNSADGNTDVEVMQSTKSMKPCFRLNTLEAATEGESLHEFQTKLKMRKNKLLELADREKQASELELMRGEDSLLFSAEHANSTSMGTGIDLMDSGNEIDVESNPIVPFVSFKHHLKKNANATTSYDNLTNLNSKRRKL